ncbi:MAG TPA: galactitol-1-phosphate 5-dehydrogenase [Rectinemataceae bacterium]|nr:galactitol-1-phosphate 5-dehydrogenase [Rectinemataceae bacterium]
MKALVLEDYGKFALRDIDRPALRGGDDVVVRVRAAAICGSDVHGMDGSTGRRRPPIVMGHEAAGEIVEAGAGVRSYRVGDRVTFDSTEYCGTCWHCRRGEVNLCDDRRVLGVSCAEYRRDGAFAEYVVVPERILYRLPEALDFVSASLAEPLGVAVHAAAITPIGLDESVAVVGTGLIGLLLVQVLRGATSGPIVALDTDESRRAAALRFGADAALDPGDPKALDELKRLTFGRGADRAFEAVGAAAPIKTAIAAVRKGGTVTLIGNASPAVELPLQDVVTRQIGLLGSCAISGEYPVALDLMARGKVDARALVSAVAPLAEGAAWFDRLYRREPGLLKVVLEP